jgi:hypothetical protein
MRSVVCYLPVLVYRQTTFDYFCTSFDDLLPIFPMLVDYIVGFWEHRCYCFDVDSKISLNLTYFLYLLWSYLLFCSDPN